MSSEFGREHQPSGASAHRGLFPGRLLGHDSLESAGGALDGGAQADDT